MGGRSGSGDADGESAGGGESAEGDVVVENSGGYAVADCCGLHDDQVVWIGFVLERVTRIFFVWFDPKLLRRKGVERQSRVG